MKESEPRNSANEGKIDSHDLIDLMPFTTFPNYNISVWYWRLHLCSDLKNAFTEYLWWWCSMLLNLSPGKTSFYGRLFTQQSEFAVLIPQTNVNLLQVFLHILTSFIYLKAFTWHIQISLRIDSHRYTMMESVKKTIKKRDPVSQELFIKIYYLLQLHWHFSSARCFLFCRDIYLNNEDESSR